MKLYDYYRSTASYRVRLALNLKNISYEKLPVHLVNNGGEQHQADYRAINPQEMVPTLLENGHVLTQSLAIIEYLEEICPTPPLLPPHPLGKAEVRSMALTIACDIHPLNVLRVLGQLRQQFQATDSQVAEWYHHWLKSGFDALEKRLEVLPRKEQFCYGNHVTMADICLVPQVYNARRFNFSLDSYPLIKKIEEHCLALPEFIDAVPHED